MADVSKSIKLLPTIFNLQKYYHPISFICAWAMLQAKKAYKRSTLHCLQRRRPYFASLSLLISLVVCFSISRRMSLIESTKSTPCSPVCVAGPDGCGCERQPGGGGQDSEQPARLPGQPALHSKWSSGKWQKGANNSIISLVQFKIFFVFSISSASVYSSTGSGWDPNPATW